MRPLEDSAHVNQRIEVETIPKTPQRRLLRLREPLAERAESVLDRVGEGVHPPAAVSHRDVAQLDPLAVTDPDNRRGVWNRMPTARPLASAWCSPLPVSHEGR